jgi:hypothetical protein
VGDVGIGTASPGGKLHTTVTDASTVLKLERTGSGATDITFDFSGANYVQSLSAGAAYIWKEGGAEHMRLDASGNVGIGTASPSQKLDVAGTSRYTFNVGNAYTLQTSLNAAGSAFADDYKNALSHIWQTSGTERMRIDSSGNVGIGTTDTTTFGAKLYVSSAGSAQASMMVWNPGIGSGQVGVAAASSNLKVYNTYSTGTLAGGVGIDIDQNGNVGIGTASPSSFNSAGLPLVVGSGSGNTGMTIYSGTANYGSLHFADGTAGADSYRGAINYFHSENAMRFYTDGTQRAIINSSGNVGIGTASPSTALQVNGTITTTGLTSSNTISGSINGNAATVTDGMYLASVQTVGGRKAFSSSQNVGSMLTASGALGGLEAVNPGGANAAFMSFHRVGAYASYFGIDTDNQFAVGGWSAGAGLAAFKCLTLGVGTATSSTTGEIRATNNVTAYYSDARLKDFKGKIGDALYKVSQLNGYYYTENEKAEEFGFKNKELQVGVSAQEVKAILPEVIAPAPFDMDAENKSKSGEDYMTVRYEKLVPLLIEAIKELKAEVEALKAAK